MTHRSHRLCGLIIALALFIPSPDPAQTTTPALASVPISCVAPSTVTTATLTSSNSVQVGFPGCSVTVYPHGSVTPATIYSNSTGTVLTQPFTAQNGVNGFFYAAGGRYDYTMTGGSNGGFPSPVTISDIVVLPPLTNFNTEFWADQYLVGTGTTTAGIAEAYAACQAASFTNAHGCKVKLGRDVTLGSSPTVTVVQGWPLYIEGNGHNVNLSCGSGYCVTFNANVPGGSANFTIKHMQFLYTGSSGGSVTAGIRVVGTDYFHSEDVTYGPQSGAASTIAAWIQLDNAEDNLFEESNFLLSQTPVLLGNTSSGGTGNLTTFLRSNFNGNNAPIVIQSGSGQVSFKDCDLEANPAKTVIKYDLTGGNSSGLQIDHSFFGGNGDGTSASNEITVLTTSGSQASVHLTVRDSTFFGTGSGEVVYNFSGNVNQALYLRLSNNYYQGFGSLSSGWLSGQQTLADNEQTSSIPGVPVIGDVIIQGDKYGSGAIAINGFLTDQTNPAASGFLRMSSVDALKFRNNANSGDVNGISKNTSDQMTVGSVAGIITGRQLLTLATAVTEASNCGSGSFAFSGWGTVTSCSVNNNSKDQAGQLNFTSPASGISAHPTITLTFADGAFPNATAPACQGTFTANLAANPAVPAASTTNVVFTFPGTPTTSSNYVLIWGCPAGD